MRTQLEQIAKLWPAIRDIFTVPQNRKEYERLLEMLDTLTDEVGEEESHPLASLIDTLGSLLEVYEARNIPEIQGDPVKTLRTLMDEHGLRQSDLPEIGSQGVVSEILSGKRALNVRQIEKLSHRFNVSPAVFV